jgi:hypothetical protein
MNLRRELWPDVDESRLWNRAEFTGFTTIPRTLPVFLRLIDHLDKQSASRVYLDLWCRAFDDYVIEVRDEYDAAFMSGYDGQRAIRTWRERIAVLDRYGFVRTHTTPHGSYRYVLVLDPHPVIEALRENGKVDDSTWIAYRSLLISIGQAAS